MPAAEATPARASNRLIDEKSPYLLQHAGNPVNWYPWGDGAFRKARTEDKPVFLSIGYATCHWCHVMAHESFEDEEVARLLNKAFVAVKVDREERPDVDKIYMAVCQALTGHGGWPLSVFMTPEGKPFFAGTYFPKNRRVGMPGFLDVLAQISNMWRHDRASIEKSSKAITEAVQAMQAGGDAEKADGLVTEKVLKKGYTQLERTFDATFGGFGAAPKFPTPHHLTFLLRWHRRSGDKAALAMVEKTLDAMRRGGIYDQIGFGFHRYSVDQRWLVPHFEKMLYDQALLTMAYTEAYQVAGNDEFARTVHEILAYVLRDMTSPEGAFYSAQDADSEGKEGLFYLWTPRAVKQHLGETTGDLLCRYYDIIEEGNFEEGLSIPHVRMPFKAFAKREGRNEESLRREIEDGRQRLYAARKKRVHPLKDDKVLTSWNGLMIASMARAGQVFEKEGYVKAAGRAVDFILKHLMGDDGRLLRRYRQGHAAYPAYLDDYAFMVWGLIELYEATFQAAYLERAVSLTNNMVDLFWDEKGHGFFFTGRGNETLITRSKELYDGALPSGNSVAALNFLRLGRMTGDGAMEEKAQQLMQAFARQIQEQPMAYTQALGVLDFMLGPSREIVLVGDPAAEATRAMIKTVRRSFVPNKVVLVRTPGRGGDRLVALAPFLKEMVPVNNKATAYVCRQYACQRPVTDVEELAARLH